jgi:hypothetical protein
VKNPEVAQILEGDRWSVAHGTVETGPYILRFRRELLAVKETSGYSQLLTILWPYADGDSGLMPSSEDHAAMVEFEEHLREAFEHDGHAIIAAILTFDGARQWVVYTDDFMECGRRIAEMPQNEDPYPIDMNTKDDPEWEYLRQEVLHGIQPDE